MRDGRLADVATRREVARADLARSAQLAQDGESRRMRERLEKLDVGVDEIGRGARHAAIVSIVVYIDNHRYMADHVTPEIKENAMTHPFTTLTLADLIQAEREAELRNDELVHAVLESRRGARPSVADRIRRLASPRHGSRPGLDDCVACA
jgi:hypothetical protein